MKYYQISHTTDTQFVGSFEQVKKLTITVDKAVNDQFDALKLSRAEFLDNLPPLDKFVLEKKALVTDVISNWFLSMNVGFIVSNKCKKLLEESNLALHRIHEVKIKGIPDTPPYFFIYLIEDAGQINYENSLFHKTNLFGIKKSDPIEISSYQDFHESNYKIQIDEPGMKLTFAKVFINNDSDMLRLPGSPNIYISERLKKQFEDNKITGLSYMPSIIPFSVT